MGASNPQGGGEAEPAKQRRRRPALVVGLGVLGAAALGGGGFAAWWFGLAGGSTGAEPAAAPIAAEDLPLPPPDARHVPVPEVMAVLADPPRVGRLAVTLETGPAPDPAAPPPFGENELRHLAEEIRRWLGSQSSADLHGAAALWLVRGRTLAITRGMYPDLKVRDVLVTTLLLQ